MIEQQLPPGFHEIQKLFGDLDAAVLKRVRASEDKHAEIEKVLVDVCPNTAEEVAVWNQLTSAGNREALRQYVQFFGEHIHDHARRLFRAVVADSDRGANAQHPAG
jgi:hypothetical protein